MLLQLILIFTKEEITNPCHSNAREHVSTKLLNLPCNETLSKTILPRINEHRNYIFVWIYRKILSNSNIGAVQTKCGETRLCSFTMHHGSGSLLNTFSVACNSHIRPK